MKSYLIFLLIFITSCATLKKENCLVKEVLESKKRVQENTYYMRVKFESCAKREDRIELVRAEFYKLNPIESSKSITINESEDKIFQIYRYEITTK